MVYGWIIGFQALDLSWDDGLHFYSTWSLLMVCEQCCKVWTHWLRLSWFSAAKHSNEGFEFWIWIFKRKVNGFVTVESSSSTSASWSVEIEHPEIRVAPSGRLS